MVDYLDPKPNRVFLDTNVIWHWHTFGDQIEEMAGWDDETIQRLGPKAIIDLEAFGWIYDAAQRYGTFDFVTSLNTLHELQSKAHDDKGVFRLEFAQELFDWWVEQIKTHYPDEDFRDSMSRARTWLGHGTFDFLPHSEDRLLVASGMAAHCSIFLTMDYKTILPYRKKIWELTRMSVSRPSQFRARFRTNRDRSARVC